MVQIILVILLILTPVTAFADRPEKMRSIEITETSRLIKATPGVVYDIIVSYKGVTSGDKVQLIDAATLDLNGTPRWTCVAATTSGVCPRGYVIPGDYTTGILYAVTKTGGNFITNVQFF